MSEDAYRNPDDPERGVSPFEVIGRPHRNRAARVETLREMGFG